MKRFDSITRKSHIEYNPDISAGDQLVFEPPPFAPFSPEEPGESSPKKRHFLSALKVMLGIGILVLSVNIVYPWADYYVKKAINGNEKTSGLQGTINPEAQTDTALAAATSLHIPIFYLKKGDLEIKAPIVDGITDQYLKDGLGHHPDSVWPNERGNVVIAGHSFALDADNLFGQIFGRLRELEIGDQVNITYQNKKYIYKIVKKEIVSAKDTSLFEKSDRWELTFYTCDPPKTDWRRLVFQADLIEIK